MLTKGDADVIAFGRYFIANPDLPEWLRLGAALTPYDRKTFYRGGPEGYIDYRRWTRIPLNEAVFSPRHVRIKVLFAYVSPCQPPPYS
ncbi:MAG: hypothetical protein QGF71_02060 [Rhodospirillales bacterium]|nr:hypothetical protein [Rhodospirillales bacterium]